MANEVSLFGSNAQPNLPAHLSGIDLGITKNLMEGMFNGGSRIGLKGSRFRLVVNGIEEGVIQENYLDTIILGAAPAVSRVYYSGAYDANTKAAPTCYSADGIVPADDVKNKQSDKCMTCPMNAKGSKIADGKQYKACSYFRRVVVMLAGDVQDRRVFKLEVKAQGLFGEAVDDSKNLNDYIKTVSTRGIDLGSVVTRISFDLNSSTPKLLFRAVRFITEEELVAVSDLVRSDEVEALKVVSMSTIDLSHEASEDEAPVAAAEPTVQQAVKPAPQQARPAPQQARPAPQQAAKPVPQTPAPQRPTASKPAPQRPAAPTVQHAVKVEDDVAVPQAAAPAKKATVQEVDTDDELAAILADL